MEVRGNIIDTENRKIIKGSIHFEDSVIKGINEETDVPDVFIMPGLIDSHIHIESSMVTPGAFAEAAVSRGTTAVVSDPHEIANVLGVDGIKYMINDAAKVPLKFYFGAPSCVPATPFESSGEIIDSEKIISLLEMPEIHYLAEMMNFPGVIHNDREVFLKINAAKKLNKPIDGHAPGLSGDSLKKYIAAGISTDHECTTLDEAKEKIALGMKVLIREGSAASNLNELKPLIRTNPEMIMLCSDDLHPEMLVRGHLERHVVKLISEGFDLFDVIASCTINPARHYKLGSGLLKPGLPADFIITEDIRKMEILETWISGKKVYDRGRLLFKYERSLPENNFNSSEIRRNDISVRATGSRLRVIDAFDRNLITYEKTISANSGDLIRSDTSKDILKIVVKERYRDLPPAIGFIHGFGLKSGAFAGSVAHDSHNIICIGTNDNDIVCAVNEIVRLNGGLSVSVDGKTWSLPLPVAGIMSDRSVVEIASEYQELSDTVKSLGCTMSSPFMTLSFMALLVIPSLKLSDNGLFDGRIFKHVPLFYD